MNNIEAFKTISYDSTLFDFSSEKDIKTLLSPENRMTLAYDFGECIDLSPLKDNQIVKVIEKSVGIKHKYVKLPFEKGCSK